MKRKLLFAALLLLATFLVCGAALAATDPIVCSMDVSPSALVEPGEVTVTITVTNSGDTDMQEPLTLYSPTSEVVTDFGDKGSVTLKAGETVTWSGTWEVNQHTLDNGQIVYFVKYALLDENGDRQVTSQPIRGKLEVAEAKTAIEVKRTITPGTAKEGQTVNIIYDITNTGTVTLKNVTLQENKDIKAKSITVATEMKAGDAAQVKIPVTMGKKDLTSSATVTYTAGGSDEKLTETVDEQKIVYGEAAMTAKLTSSAKGGAVGETVKLTLELKNSGTVDYTDIRVTDPTLGDVFTDQSLPAGETLTLEKDITLEATAEYKFTVIATDSTGTETQVDVDSLTLTVVDPTQIVHLTLVAAADRTEVYSQPGTVRFTLTITNDSAVEAKDVKITEASTTLYTFASIPAGETRSLTRDASLSMAGKYQFTASTADALGNAVTFDSNEIQIAFSVPTPAPATPTPAAQPTAEPTYAAITYVPISDPSVGTAPKLIRVFFYPLMIVSGILLIVAAVLLLIATKKRMDEKHASEAALDHLDRAKRRDYIAPNEEADGAPKAEPPAPADAASGGDAPVSAPAEPDAITEEELPHMKYVRNAYQHAGNAREAASGAAPLEDAPSTGEPEPPTPDNREEIYGRPREAEPSAPPPEAEAPQQETKATLAEELRAYRERDEYFHEPVPPEPEEPEASPRAGRGNAAKKRRTFTRRGKDDGKE